MRPQNFGGGFMNIKTRAESIVKKYNTNNPFEIADKLNIKINFMNYPEEVNGLYIYVHRNSLIFINDNLPYMMQKVVCAHELGHAVLHHQKNSTFMKSYTLFSIPKHENEANLFCTYLLLPEKDLVEYENLTIEQIAAATFIPVHYIKLRLQK